MNLGARAKDSISIPVRLFNAFAPLLISVAFIFTIQWWIHAVEASGRDTTDMGFAILAVFPIWGMAALSILTLALYRWPKTQRWGWTGFNGLTGLYLAWVSAGALTQAQAFPWAVFLCLTILIQIGSVILLWVKRQKPAPKAASAG